MSCKGVVIRESAYGESDKCLTVLTDTMGSISVFCKGAKNYKSKFMVCAQLFCYSEMELYQRADKYWMKESALLENFYGIRENVTVFALAQYFCDVTCDVTRENQSDEQIQRLLLNTLYVLEKQSKPLLLVKGVFEMRVCALSGFCPFLVGCAVCGEYENGRMYFDIANGTLFCSEHKSNAPEHAHALSSAVLHALRWAVYAQAQRIFAFELPEEELKAFSRIAESYLLHHLDRQFHTLEFYHSIEEL